MEREEMYFGIINSEFHKRIHTKSRSWLMLISNTKKLLTWTNDWGKRMEEKYRSSHRRRSVGKGVLNSFTKFTGKHLCQSLFFNEVAALRHATLLKKRRWRSWFPVNFVKFVRTPFFTEHLRTTTSDSESRFYQKLKWARFLLASFTIKAAEVSFQKIY